MTLSKRYSLVLFAALSLNPLSKAISVTTINDGNEHFLDNTLTDNIYYVDHGTLNITSSGNLSVTSSFRIVRSGTTGTTNIINGGQLNIEKSATSVSLAVGGSESNPSAEQIGTGTLNIIGSGSALISHATNEHFVGGYGSTGIVNILDGGNMLLQSSELWIGGRGSSTETKGTVNIDGNESLLYVANRLRVGTYNEGFLNVTNGGQAYAEVGIYVGNESQTHGKDSTIYISDAGSVVQSSAGVFVALSGDGTAIVANEGTLAGTALWIGYYDGSNGTVIVGGKDEATGAGYLNFNKINFRSGNGNLIFNHTENDYVLSSAISGYGDIELRNGTTWLTGNNRQFTGNLTIGSGSTLGVIRSNNLSQYGVQNDGTLLIQNEDDWYFTQPVTGQGDLIKQGQGTLLLKDGYKATGNTTVHQGTLQIGQSYQDYNDIEVFSSPLITINHGATLAAYSSISGDITSNGRVELYTNAQANGHTQMNTGGELIMEAGSLATSVTLNGGMLSITDLTDETTSYAPARVNNLTSDNGYISFLRDSNGDYAALSIGELNGTGHIFFNTSLAERNSNFITIDQGTGKFGIVVSDSGEEIADHGGLTQNLVNDIQGNIDFTLETGYGRNTKAIDGGVYMYTLYRQEEKDGMQGNVWYLGAYDGSTPEPEPEPEPDTDTNTNSPDPDTSLPKTTPSTDAVLEMASATVAVMNAELDGLRAYRATLIPNQRQGSNAWGHYIGSTTHLDTSNGAAYKLNQNGIEVGGDFSTEFEQGSLISGAYISYSDNHVKHLRGGSSKIDSYGLGIYATWFDNSGFYLDGVLKGNRLNSALKARMTNGDYTTGDWHQYAVSSALETGYRFTATKRLYIEPYLRAMTVQANNASVKLSNGMKARTGKPRSFSLEAGGRLGTQLTLGNMDVKPYLQAAVIQEMVKSNSVTLNKHYQFDNNLDGTSGRYGAGASVEVTSNATLYGEMNYRQGQYIEEPLHGVVGLKVAF